MSIPNFPGGVQPGLGENRGYPFKFKTLYVILTRKCNIYFVNMQKTIILLHLLHFCIADFCYCRPTIESIFLGRSVLSFICENLSASTPIA